MNVKNRSFEKLIQKLELGSSLKSFERIDGGALHAMWKVTTEK
jgi:hypothetical protein